MGQQDQTFAIAMLGTRVPTMACPASCVRVVLLLAMHMVSLPAAVKSNGTTASGKRTTPKPPNNKSNGRATSNHVTLLPPYPGPLAKALPCDLFSSVAMVGTVPVGFDGSGSGTRNTVEEAPVNVCEV